jgi:hypothetical protein
MGPCIKSSDLCSHGQFRPAFTDLYPLAPIYHYFRNWGSARFRSRFADYIPSQNVKRLKYASDNIKIKSSQIYMHKKSLRDDPIQAQDPDEDDAMLAAISES